MSKRSDDAPALAGWAGNPNAPVEQRLAAAAQALDFYVDTHDRLHKLLTDCQSYVRRTDVHDPYDKGIADTYGVVADRLRAILDDRDGVTE